MGRAPCCEKMGLKRGPWSPEEDQILINFIKENGHSNWRALPKKAGLLRCGKSCRLRWTNYLRPDIKRGDFSLEEEEAIIKLHELLGNRWSAIAARLPGRTDNEIKNVWHTHLKKRLNQNQASKELKSSLIPSEGSEYRLVSPQLSSVNCCNNINESDDTISTELGLSETLFESLWQNEDALENDWSLESNNGVINGGQPPPEVSMESIDGWTSDTVDIMDFWSNVLIRDEEIFPQLYDIK